MGLILNIVYTLIAILEILLYLGCFIGVATLIFYIIWRIWF